MANDRIFIICTSCVKEYERDIEVFDKWAIGLGKHFMKEWYALPEKDVLQKFMNDHFWCGTGAPGRTLEIQWEDTVLARKEEDNAVG